MEDMSDYSSGRRNEAYGSVTRVVIGSSASSAERIQLASSSAATWTTSARQQQGYRSLPTASGPGPHQEDERSPPTTTRGLPAASKNQQVKEFAMTADRVQMLAHLRSSHQCLPDLVDERQRAAFTSPPVVQRVSVARQQTSVVRSYVLMSVPVSSPFNLIETVFLSRRKTP